MKASWILVLVAALLLALSSASARQDRRVRSCIKRKNCIARGHRAVCAENQDGDRGAFPNDCYRRCANKERGAHWSKLYSFPTSAHCIRNWLSDPSCSTCPTKYVGRGTRIESSLLLGNGAWLSDSQLSEAIENGQHVYGVGENCFLRRCIVDENPSIGNDVQIINRSGVKEADRSSDSGFMIQDGIVVIMRNAEIPDGVAI